MNSGVKVESDCPNFPKSDFIKIDAKINPRYYKQAYRTQWESMPDFKGMCQLLSFFSNFLNLMIIIGF